MKNLSKQIDEIVEQAIFTLSHKVSGTLFLELLKYKVIDKLKEIKIHIEDDTKTTNKTIFEDTTKKVDINFIYNETKAVNLLSQLKDHILLINLNNQINLQIEDDKTKKLYNINLNPSTGVVLSRGTKYSLSYSHKSIFIEIYLVDKKVYVENLK